MLNTTLRLYRGLKNPYDPDRVGERQPGPLIATDFTDCPYTALTYANTRRGVVLVVDVPADGPRVSIEDWLATDAKRYMLWGRFDEWITAEFPAKQLRSRIRVKGVWGGENEYKSVVHPSRPAGLLVQEAKPARASAS